MTIHGSQERFVGRIELYLHDGRMLDLSDLSIEEILRKLLRERITPEMVRETRHILDVTVTPLPGTGGADDRQAPLCRCPAGVCLLHPTLPTCGMRERPVMTNTEGADDQ